MPRINQNKVDIKRFLNEIQNNAVFDNDNIARIYSADIINNYYYVLMEYCHGTTLRKYLQTHPSYCERVYILNSVVSTMHTVYEEGLYHGDLHSKNIMINNKNVKIIDFGTSIFNKNRAISHKRDAHMLFDLAIEILPELKNLAFFNDHVREKSSKSICECILYLIHLLCIEMNDYGDFSYDFYLIELALITKHCSALNYEDVALYIKNELFQRFYESCKVNSYKGTNEIIDLNKRFLCSVLLNKQMLIACRDRHECI